LRVVAIFERNMESNGIQKELTRAGEAMEKAEKRYKEAKEKNKESEEDYREVEEALMTKNPNGSKDDLLDDLETRLERYSAAVQNKVEIYKKPADTYDKLVEWNAKSEYHGHPRSESSQVLIFRS
jgi:transposase